MKKLFIILALLFISCEKEDIKEPQTFIKALKADVGEVFQLRIPGEQKAYFTLTQDDLNPFDIIILNRLSDCYETIDFIPELYNAEVMINNSALLQIESTQNNGLSIWRFTEVNGVLTWSINTEYTDGTTANYDYVSDITPLLIEEFNYCE